jgi:hypothetical protein
MPWGSFDCPAAALDFGKAGRVYRETSEDVAFGTLA